MIHSWLYCCCNFQLIFELLYTMLLVISSNNSTYFSDGFECVWYCFVQEFRLSIANLPTIQELFTSLIPKPSNSSCFTCGHWGQSRSLIALRRASVSACVCGYLPHPSCLDHNFRSVHPSPFILGTHVSQFHVICHDFHFFSKIHNWVLFREFPLSGLC